MFHFSRHFLNQENYQKLQLKGRAGISRILWQQSRSPMCCCWRQGLVKSLSCPAALAPCILGLPCQELQRTSTKNFLPTNYIKIKRKNYFQIEVPIHGHQIPNPPSSRPKGSRRAAGGCSLGCLMEVLNT